eukprot:SAG22_NODE_515_length_9566_cov_29.378789_3_plen_217_part_00
MRATAAAAVLLLPLALHACMLRPCGAPKSKWKTSEAVGKTIPDHYSGKFHSADLHHAAMSGHVDEIVRHIKNGEDPNGLDKYGQTPMHYAAIYDRKDILELLHEHGGELEPRNEHNMTPLHYSARSDDVHSLKMLIEKGADIHALDNFNATPLTHAAQKGHEEPAHHLLHAGAKHDHKSWDHVHQVHRTVAEWGHHKEHPEIGETISRFLERANDL